MREAKSVYSQNPFKTKPISLGLGLTGHNSQNVDDERNKDFGVSGVFGAKEF